MSDSLNHIATPTDGSLPEPETARWQPLRSGLLNVFRYDYEEFHFKQGRLLIRGNNGTGKSRVLALQMPFLFDGEVSPHRVEPDGDAAKRIECNLLMGKYPDRLGYTWIEFGRIEADGRAKYVTLGIGLHAVQGRGAPNRWYFVTKQRVGRDLFLQSSSGHPLPMDRLTESLGSEGQLYSTAREYRRAVDASLFRLGEQRYRALVDLLIQLRQPQLSRDLDEQKLSSVLSEALPPVSQQVVVDVAESFRGLEGDRLELDRFQAAGESVDAFLREYRQYARIASRRRAERVRTCHSAYEGTQRRLKAARSEKETASQRLSDLQREVTQLLIDEKGAAAEIETLENSPQMRSARDLDLARRTASERSNAANTCHEEHDQAIKGRHDADEAMAAAAAQKNVKWNKVEQALETASSQASQAGMQTPHQTGISLLDLPDLDDPDAVQSASELLEAEAMRRRKAVRHVRGLESAVQSAGTHVTAANKVQVEMVSQVDAAVERQQDAQELLKTRSQAQVRAYEGWATTVSELLPASSDMFAEQFRIWCETGSGKSPMTKAIQDALTSAKQKLISAMAAERRLLQDTRILLAEMETEREALLGGRHEPPPTPYTRNSEGRATRKGAPLWTVVDFCEDLSVIERAGLEAALEASGILDAWIAPDGTIRGRGEEDVFIELGATVKPSGRHLGEVLQPDTSLAGADSQLPASIVEGILEHIGVGRDSGQAWVDVDGSWRNGPLRGAWVKSSAQHIGHTARESRRLERLRVLEGEIELTQQTERETVAAIEGLAKRELAAQAEADQAPQDDIIIQAMAGLSVATSDVNRAREKAAEAERRAGQAREALASAIEKRNNDARDLGVADWVDRLQELDDGINEYRNSLAALWPAIGVYVTVRQAAKTAERRVSDAAAEVSKRHALMILADQQAKEAVARRDILETAVGAAAGEILGRLEAASQRARSIRERKEKSIEQRGIVQGAINTAEERIVTQEDELSKHSTDRAAAIGALRALVDAELLAVAAPGLAMETMDWEAVSPAVDLARRVESMMLEVSYDDAAWGRNQQGLYNHIQSLTDSLVSRDMRPETTLKDELLIVKVLFHGRNCAMPELRQTLHDEVTARSTLLEEREREVLENTLIGEVATHLHERIRDGERLVKEMNNQIENRPTSTGMRLRFSWDPAVDGPPGLTEARKRLLGATGVWSPEERQALGRFLQSQIQAVRAENAAGTWQEHLAEALDYRSWHRFGVMRQQDGQWKRLTRQTHGTGSGGEKAVALTIPMFAAAAAHYASADANAPRIILLDEAFVGIDADMRSKCMGLLCAFDLDFMMTSEREWACYPTLPGIAIYHLTSREGIDAILTTRWVWNGKELAKEDPVLPVPCRPAVRIDARHPTPRGSDGSAERESHLLWEDRGNDG